MNFKKIILGMQMYGNKRRTFYEKEFNPLMKD
jgi:hypothetical protein